MATVALRKPERPGLSRAPEARGRPGSRPAPARVNGVPVRFREPAQRKEILRFRRSERLLHWSIALPFMVCYASAAILVVFYNSNPLRPHREVFSWIHRISGVCLFVFPLLTLAANRHDYRIHLYNIKQAWIWTLDDLKWLFLMGLAAVSKKFSLPEQGKFNAAEKLNFMMVMCSYPLYIVTGVLIWLPGVAFVSWVLHVSMAVVATPLVLGHIFMAVVNPGTRIGLQGMISGFVDREWAKHHYRRWYRENFERAPRAERIAVSTVPPEQGVASARCPSCDGEHPLASWPEFFHSVVGVEPLVCPGCGTDISAVAVSVEPREVEWLLRQLEGGGFRSSPEARPSPIPNSPVPVRGRTAFSRLPGHPRS